MKYRSGLWLIPDLTSLLEACVRSWYRPEDLDAVVAVPLHPTRFRSRGFNQAAILAARLARRLGVSFHGRWLRRIRLTQSQTHLTAEDRAPNVRGAFDVVQPLAVLDQKILVVDDVMTTGATVGEVSRVLKQAGAASVWVATVARG
jgi:ComF family protein